MPSYCLLHSAFKGITLVENVGLTIAVLLIVRLDCRLIIC